MKLQIFSRVTWEKKAKTSIVQLMKTRDVHCFSKLEITKIMLFNIRKYQLESKFVYLFLLLTTKVLQTTLQYDFNFITSNCYNIYL